MINISKLRWKNLLSYGNNWTEMVFDNGKITLFHGENGNGKSAFYEALFFCLYGKPFRKIKKSGLVNNINGKDLLVEIDLEKSGKTYQIKRGIKPDIFEIWVNGTLRPQPASVRDYQEFLETHILQMDEKTFKQSVILGSTDYVPFMQLSAGERRVVVEDFLNVGIYSAMAQIAKAKISNSTQVIRDIDSKIQILKVKIEMKKAELSRIEGRNSQDLDNAKEEVEKISQELSVAEEETRKLEVEMFAHTPDIWRSRLAETKSSIQNSNQSIYSESTRLQAVNKEMNFFSENQTCPTCTQEITEDFKKNREASASVTSMAIIARKEILERERADLLSLEKEITEKLDLFQVSVQAVKESILKRNSIEERLNKAKAVLKNLESQTVSDSTELKAEIKSIAKEGKEISSAKGHEESEKGQWESLALELKDSGVKNKIVRDYLPSINKLIKRYLDILEFPVNFTFNENFEETILSRGREDFSYGNFSKGESLRLDLALLFTWREITRIKSSAYCNLLVLDEIGDSSLDASGFDSFMKILHSDRAKQSVMIISHKPSGISSRVDTVIEVTKKSGFSTFNSITENDPHEQLL